MSHVLQMQVQNNSSLTLTWFSIAHSWDGHNELLTGGPLAPGAYSNLIPITSGYTQFDWYTVQLVFGTNLVRQTNFYCNSSHNDGQVLFNLHDDYLDCMYYSAPGGTYHSGCKHKEYSGLFQDEIDQKDPVKIEPK